MNLVFYNQVWGRAGGVGEEEEEEGGGNDNKVAK